MDALCRINFYHISRTATDGRELNAAARKLYRIPKARVFDHHPVTDLVLCRSAYMDLLLHRLWQFFGLDELVEVSLVVVGVMGVVSYTLSQTSIS